MFVRSLLAMSLSCIIANVALAASTTEQPLNPKKVSAPVEDPIDPLAVDAASTAKTQAQTQITAQEQNDLNRASTTLQNLQKAEDPNADSGIAASEPTAPAKTATATKTSTPAPAVSWTLDSLNNADWYENIGKGQLPVYARAHVMLNNAHASPGAIDGMSGKNTLKAIASFQQMNGLSPTGELTKKLGMHLLQNKQNQHLLNTRLPMQT